MAAETRVWMNPSVPASDMAAFPVGYVPYAPFEDPVYADGGGCVVNSVPWMLTEPEEGLGVAHFLAHAAVTDSLLRPESAEGAHMWYTDIYATPNDVENHLVWLRPRVPDVEGTVHAYTVGPGGGWTDCRRDVGDAVDYLSDGMAPSRLLLSAIRYPAYDMPLAALERALARTSSPPPPPIHRVDLDTAHVVVQEGNRFVQCDVCRDGATPRGVRCSQKEHEAANCVHSQACDHGWTPDQVGYRCPKHAVPRGTFVCTTEGDCACGHLCDDDERAAACCCGCAFVPNLLPVAWEPMFRKACAMERLPADRFAFTHEVGIRLSSSSMQSVCPSPRRTHI